MICKQTILHAGLQAGLVDFCEQNRNTGRKNPQAMQASIYIQSRGSPSLAAFEDCGELNVTIVTPQQ